MSEELETMIDGMDRGPSFGRRPFMAALLLVTICHPQLHAQGAQPANSFDVTSLREGRYYFQSNAWVNLHQRLVHEARFGTAPPAALTGPQLGTWNRLVGEYERFLGNRNPIFNLELISMNLALSETSSTHLPDSILPPASTILEAAMPLYLAAQWEQDDRANRFWMRLAQALIDSAGEELAAAHANAYGVPFPTRIRVDVSPLAWQFGAYTVGEGDFAHVVITSTEAGYQGYAALEMLMHEPSHAIVDARAGAVGGDLTRIAAELGVTPPPNLWHAILFYTSGELTRQALESRGVADYPPVILGMYQRGFAGFRNALETHWQSWLDGTITREEALRRILIDTARKSDSQETRPQAERDPLRGIRQKH